MSEQIFISNKKEATLFNAMGFKVYILNKEDEVNELFKTLTKETKVIAYDSDLKDMILKFKRYEGYPLFLEIPFSSDKKGSKQLEIKEKIKKSIGIDLL